MSLRNTLNYKFILVKLYLKLNKMDKQEQSSIMDAGELEAVIGNPWSVLPIKNNKYAKDLVEVHLSDRGLN